MTIRPGPRSQSRPSTCIVAPVVTSSVATLFRPLRPDPSPIRTLTFGRVGDDDVDGVVGELHDTRGTHHTRSPSNQGKLTHPTQSCRLLANVIVSSHEQRIVKSNRVPRADTRWP